MLTAFVTKLRKGGCRETCDKQNFKDLFIALLKAERGLSQRRNITI